MQSRHRQLEKFKLQKTCVLPQETGNIRACTVAIATPTIPAQKDRTIIEKARGVVLFPITLLLTAQFADCIGLPDGPRPAGRNKCSTVQTQQSILFKGSQWPTREEPVANAAILRSKGSGIIRWRSRDGCMDGWMRRGNGSVRLRRSN